MWIEGATQLDPGICLGGLEVCVQSVSSVLGGPLKEIGLKKASPTLIMHLQHVESIALNANHLHDHCVWRKYQRRSLKHVLILG